MHQQLCVHQCDSEGCFITVFYLISGQTPSSWAQELHSRDFQLLCRDGSTAEVTDWRKCHLARVPAHAVVVRPDTDGSLIFQMLKQGQVDYVFWCLLYCFLSCPSTHRA